VNIPIDPNTGQPFQYERIPYTLANGQTVDLYSIVKKDYNGDGVFNLDDVSYIWNNRDNEVMNLPALDGFDPARIYNGLEFVVTKRFSDRAQLLGSFLYSNSHGPANRNNFQDWNIEGPEIMDTTSFGSLNNALNNMTGPLPFTPKYEIKVSGSYFLPKVDTDLGLRLRYSSGRPYWLLYDYGAITLAPWSSEDDLATGVLDTGAPPVIVGEDPNHPVYLPHTTVLDLRIAKAFEFARGQNLQVSLDVFNIFNSNAVINADYQFNLGQVTAVTTPSRKFRLGLSYSF
jgi:hypothetical protein